MRYTDDTVQPLGNLRRGPDCVETRMAQGTQRASVRRIPRLEGLEDRCLLSGQVAITAFPIPTANYSPYGITTGPDGNLWFTEPNNMYPGNNIGVINPTTHAITEFPVPTAFSMPYGITTGPDGNLWFTEVSGNKIGEINPTTHAITEFPVPTANSQPYDITTGLDGNLWFTEYQGNNIGEINPTTHAITEFPVPTANSQPCTTSRPGSTATSGSPSARATTSG